MKMITFDNNGKRDKKYFHYMPAEERHLWYTSH